MGNLARRNEIRARMQTSRGKCATAAADAQFGKLDLTTVSAFPASAPLAQLLSTPELLLLLRTVVGAYSIKLRFTPCGDDLLWQWIRATLLLYIMSYYYIARIVETVLPGYFVHSKSFTRKLSFIT
ncbi:hypothetical protein TSAR_012360 [Trichomalopsis sarcophagae]|uniref:Uncharacterized protein n=1 Tax=Trichomalopsis sarcophagae TaxID=543379 RepID=A0A232F1H1_9HYME|nr:hypothetical protein TSAR_012360 [Trichomalopsis sarcophagae]